MSTQPSRNGDASDAQEAAEEEELATLEQEVDQMAQKILEYRTTLPDQLTSTLASLLASQRPVLPAHLLHESEGGAGQDPARESTDQLPVDNTEEAGKIRLLEQKISSNASALPVVLNRMKEYMARIDKLEASNGIIHPAFKRKRDS